MIFLIQYDRRAGKIVEKRGFGETNREKAERERLALELALRRQKIQHEVVLLEAQNEEALQRTHSRYFEDVSEAHRAIRTSLSV